MTEYSKILVKNYGLKYKEIFEKLNIKNSWQFLKCKIVRPQAGLKK